MCFKNLMRATGQFCSVRGVWDTKNNLIKAIGQFGNQGVEEGCFKLNEGNRAIRQHPRGVGY